MTSCSGKGDTPLREGGGGCAGADRQVRRLTGSAGLGVHRRTGQRIVGLRQMGDALGGKKLAGLPMARLTVQGTLLRRSIKQMMQHHRH
jgi:hypothetical protein